LRVDAPKCDDGKRRRNGRKDDPSALRQNNEKGERDCEAERHEPPLRAALILLVERPPRS
jgi:hypothetical protein